MAGIYSVHGIEKGPEIVSLFVSFFTKKSLTFHKNIIQSSFLNVYKYIIYEWTQAFAML